MSKWINRELLAKIVRSAIHLDLLSAEELRSLNVGDLEDICSNLVEHELAEDAYNAAMKEAKRMLRSAKAEARPVAVARRTFNVLLRDGSEWDVKAADRVAAVVAARDGRGKFLGVCLKPPRKDSAREVPPKSRPAKGRAPRAKPAPRKSAERKERK